MDIERLYRLHKLIQIIALNNSNFDTEKQITCKNDVFLRIFINFVKLINLLLK
jgi:hypothetical protein